MDYGRFNKMHEKSIQKHHEKYEVQTKGTQNNDVSSRDKETGRRNAYAPIVRSRSMSTPVVRMRDCCRGDLKPAHFEDNHSSPVGSHAFEACMSEN